MHKRPKSIGTCNVLLDTIHLTNNPHHSIILLPHQHKYLSMRDSPSHLSQTSTAVTVPAAPDNTQCPTSGKPPLIWLSLRRFTARALLLILLILLSTKMRFAHLANPDMSESTPSTSSSSSSSIPSQCEPPTTIPELRTAENIDEQLEKNPDIMKTTGTNRNLLLPDSLKQYITFHATSLKCLHSPTCTNKPKVLVWECATQLCGGVGDRMRGIRQVFLMAVATKRLFFIDWPRTSVAPFDLSVALLPAAIDWRLQPSIRQLLYSKTSALPTQSLFYFPDNGKLLVRYNYRKPVVYDNMIFQQSHGIADDRNEKWDLELAFSTNTSDLVQLFKDSDVVHASNRNPRSSLLNFTLNTYAGDRLQGLQRDFNDQVGLERRVTRILFTPSPTIIQAVHKRIPPLSPFNGFPDGDTGLPSSYISVHARVGDDMGEHDGIGRLSQVQKDRSQTAYRLLRCGITLHNFIHRESIRNGMSNIPQVHIFLASDSVKFKKIFSELAQRSMPPVNVYTSDQKVVHVDHRQAAYGGVLNEMELCDGFVDVFADLVAMANASAMAFLHSGYPVMALAMSTINRWKELDGGGAFSDSECVIGGTKKKHSFATMYGV